MKRGKGFCQHKATLCEILIFLICQFVPISEKVYVLCTELMLLRNGAKTYVKNPRVLHREKIRETGFYEIF